MIATQEALRVSQFGVRAAMVELGCLILLVEIIEWIVPLTAYPRGAYAVPASLLLLLLMVCFVRDGVSATELGIRFDNLPRVFSRILPALSLFVLLTVAIGISAGTLDFGKRFYSMLITVPLWAFIQQYMLLAFAHRRVRLIIGTGTRAELATAALFAALHLPNPILTVVCAAGGFIWARVYDRDPNLLANALTHAIASAFLANSLQHTLLKNMVVGYNYFLR